MKIPEDLLKNLNRVEVLIKEYYAVAIEVSETDHAAMLKADLEKIDDWKRGAVSAKDIEDIKVFLCR